MPDLLPLPLSGKCPSRFRSNFLLFYPVTPSMQVLISRLKQLCPSWVMPFCIVSRPQQSFSHLRDVLFPYGGYPPILPCRLLDTCPLLCSRSFTEPVLPTRHDVEMTGFSAFFSPRREGPHFFQI